MQEQLWTELTVYAVGSVDSSTGRCRLQSWIKDGCESDLMRLLEESHRPLKFAEIIDLLPKKDGRVSFTRKKVQRQLDRWRCQNIVETLWVDGEVCYFGKGQGREIDAMTSGSSFRLAVIRDKGRISFASQPQNYQADATFHDRLLVAFCFIALGTLFGVACYLFMG